MSIWMDNFPRLILVHKGTFHSVAPQDCPPSCQSWDSPSVQQVLVQICVTFADFWHFSEWIEFSIVIVVQFSVGVNGGIVSFLDSDGQIHKILSSDFKKWIVHGMWKQWNKNMQVEKCTNAKYTPSQCDLGSKVWANTEIHKLRKYPNTQIHKYTNPQSTKIQKYRNTS